MLYLGETLIEYSRFNELSIFRTNFTVLRKKNSRFNELLGAFYDPMFIKYMFKAKINGYPTLNKIQYRVKNYRNENSLILCKIFSILNNHKASFVVYQSFFTGYLQHTRNLHSATITKIYCLSSDNNNTLSISNFPLFEVNVQLQHTAYLSLILLGSISLDRCSLITGVINVFRSTW